MSAVDLKVVLLGHKNVGKTALFNRYVYDDFGKTTMTIGAYFSMKQCRVNDRVLNLAIWDTAGEEKFDSLTNFYCRNANAALICYDITEEASFTGIQKWVDKITMEAEENCSICVVGNKLDIAQDDAAQRRVMTHEAERFAKNLKAEAWEVSAKTGENVVDVFTKVVSMCLERQKPLPLHEQGRGSNRVDVNARSGGEGDKKCCK